MENRKILQQAILKAEKNGYKEHLDYCPFFLKRHPEKKNKLTQEEFLEIVSLLWLRNINNIIFSHNFAKAFWGEEDMWYTTKCTCGGLDFHVFGHDAHHPECKRVKATRGYKFHLAKMVVQEEPLKYLEKFL